MKKILTLFIILMLGIIPTYAKDKKNHTIKFDGEKYTLLYSTKNPEFGGYINEYYKRGETYNIWSEMIGVHHFPNAYSPIDQIVEFRKYLNSENCPSSMSFDEDKNIGIIDFVMISENHALVIMEFNVFKYTKSDKCGSVAIQYAKRYAVKNAFEAEAVKKEFAKTRKQAIKNVSKMEVPAVVAEEIDKCAGGINKNAEKTKEEINAKNEKNADEERSVTEEQTTEVTEEVKEDTNVTDKTETEEVNNVSEKTENQITEEIEEDINTEVPAAEYAPVPVETTDKKAIPAEEKKQKNSEVKQKEEKNVAEKKQKSSEVKQKEEKNVAEKKQKNSEVKQKEEKNVAEKKQKSSEVKQKEEKNVAEKKQKSSEVKQKEEKNVAEKKQENKKVKKKNKKHKENPYRVENSKDQYYAQPRDYKEVVAECKRLQKELKKQKKLEKKRAKKAAKNLEK